MDHINIAARQLPKQIFRHYRAIQQLDTITITSFYEDNDIPIAEIERGALVDYWRWQQSDGNFFSWRLTSTEAITD